MGRMIDTLRSGQWTSAGETDNGVDWQRAMDLAGSVAEAIGISDKAIAAMTRRKRFLQPLIEAAVPVVADDVAAYVFSQPEPLAMREWDWAKDFPVLSPPFPRFFVEWRKPHDVLSVHAMGQEIGQTMAGREGVLFMGGSRSSAGECPVRGLVTQGVDYEHFLCFWTFYDFSGDWPGELGRTGGLLIDRHGCIVGEPVIEDLNKHKTIMIREGLIRFVAAVGLLAVSFMHCKSGVQIRDVEPSPKLNRARERRGKRPLVRYKTLVIDGLKELLRREGNVGENGLKKALHLVRGHFATFSPDRPLFGHFVGTVFRSAHLRGKKDHGQVIKDYEIKRGAR